MNIKKAYRFFISNSSTSKEEMKNLIMSAQNLEIIVSAKKALDPRNSRALSRTGFWTTLKYRVESILKECVIKHLQESGQLFVGREFWSDENKVVVTSIYFNKIAVKNVEGRICANHNILHHFPFDMSVLPGDDTEGENFWKEYSK